MKKAKRVTKREKKAMLKFMKEMEQNQPKSEVAVKPKSSRPKPLITLTKFLANQEKKKSEKALHRQEKRASKEEAKHKKHDHKHDHDHEHEHK
jgi:ABC-type Zn2+ transport system substrate-binding protein/surface adhesin